MKETLNCPMCDFCIVGRIDSKTKCHSCGFVFKFLDEFKQKKQIQCPLCDFAVAGRVGSRLVCPNCGQIFKIIKEI